MPLRRVVITGLGALSPLGLGMDAMMGGLYAGRSAVVNMRAAWAPKIADLNCWLGAPLPEPPDAREIPRKFRRTMGPVAVMALLAAREALAEAALPEEWPASGRMGVSIASTTGSVSCMETIFSDCLLKGSMANLPAGSFFQLMSHSAAANVAYALGIRGVTLSPNSACTSSAQAIGLAAEAIAQGTQDVFLCGGAEELHPIVAASLDLVQAASWHYNDSPGRSPRPFDRDRDGTVCGEGAGILILEAEEVARARSARILAEVAGFATTTDGTHLAEPHAESIEHCLHNVLDKSGLVPEEVDYVNAHATGTGLGDIAEAQAIAQVLQGRPVPVSSLKGALGHTLGACGALELAAAIRMMRDGRLAPTLNLETPGEGCEALDHVREARACPIRVMLKNSFAFGGINAVLAIKRYQP